MSSKFNAARDAVASTLSSIEDDLGFAVHDMFTALTGGHIINTWRRDEAGSIELQVTSPDERTWKFALSEKFPEELHLDTQASVKLHKLLLARVYISEAQD